MKLCKLRWLIYYFLYKLNRWLGGKTKWEKEGNIKIPQYEYEKMMERVFLRTLEWAVNELAEIWKKLYGGKMCPCAIIPNFYNSREPKFKPEKVDTSKFRINESIGFINKTEWHWFNSVS